MQYPETRTFWMESTGRLAVGLRRYSSAQSTSRDCEGGYHSALVFTGRACAHFRDQDRDRDGCKVLADLHTTPHDDPRWPAHCRCGYAFTSDDQYQDWEELLYHRADTGDIVTIRSHGPGDTNAPKTAPPGATWDAWWLPPSWRGPDGIALMVRLPNGHDWIVDSRASNCTLPEDDVHKCWVRRGDPRQANVTVGKIGLTCAAGAGSILAGDYHGFLTAGILSAG